LPFRQAWPQAPHIADTLPDMQIHWFHTYLYANGDLLAIYHGDDEAPYGYGLAKLDKDSKLLWAYANNVHHDLDVAEDGTIYMLTQKIIRDRCFVQFDNRRITERSDVVASLSPTLRATTCAPLQRLPQKRPTG
jgi:hypothetical protein